MQLKYSLGNTISLHCTRCWTAEYSHKLNLTHDETKRLTIIVPLNYYSSWAFKTMLIEIILSESFIKIIILISSYKDKIYRIERTSYYGKSIINK